MLRERVAGACCGSKLPRVYRPLETGLCLSESLGTSSVQNAITIRIRSERRTANNGFNVFVKALGAKDRVMS